MKKSPLIFLSYSRKDQEIVKKVYERLQAEGSKPWMDQFDILPGEDWERSIKNAIKKADFFLVFLSKNSVNRRGILQKEIRAALDSRNGMLPDDIYLIPVRLSDCDIPEDLSSFQWVDFFDDSGWSKLLLAIKYGLKRRRNDPKNKK